MVQAAGSLLSALMLGLSSEFVCDWQSLPPEHFKAYVDSVTYVDQQTSNRWFEPDSWEHTATVWHVPSEAEISLAVSLLERFGSRGCALLDNMHTAPELSKDAKEKATRLLKHVALGSRWFNEFAIIRAINCFASGILGIGL